MPRLFGVLTILLLASACGERAADTAADPLDPFFRQEVGPPCERNTDCATGLCDRLLLPGSGQGEAQGVCSSVPFAIFAWQRALIVANLVAVAGGDEGLRERVMIFSAGALRAPDAPISLRLLALELTKALLGDEPGWAALIESAGGAWSLPAERLLAAVIRAGRDAETDAWSRLAEMARRGPEGHRIRAARELASLCISESRGALVELATTRESRFVRDAVVLGIEACPGPLRGEILAAAAADAMPYERARFLLLGFEGGDASSGESTTAE